jgi:tetratricopeptide (TPR) repeat protein
MSSGANDSSAPDAECSQSLAHAQATRGHFRRAGALLLVAIVLAVPLYLIGRQVRGFSRWRQAEQAIAQGDLESAFVHLEICLRIWPDSSEAHLLMARTCRRMNDLARADDHLRRADRLGEPSEELELEHLMLQVQSGELDPGVEILRQRIRERHYAQALMLEALVKGHIRAHFLPEAHFWASLWVKHDPNSGDARYLRALALRRQMLGNSGEIESVRQDLDQALCLNPHHIPARLLLAEVLEASGRPTEAVTHFETYREQRPTDAAAVVGHTRCLRALGRTRQAREELDGWLKKYGEGTADAYLLRGQLELELDGDPTQALEWLETSLKLGPNYDDTLHTLALLLRRLGRHTEADKYEQQCLRVRGLLARLQEISKRITVESSADLRYEAANIQMQLGNEERALSWLRSALQDDAEHRKTHQALAEFYRGKGNLEQAAIHQRAADEKPGPATIRR